MADRNTITTRPSSSDVEAHKPASHTPGTPNSNEKASTDNFGPAPDGGLKAWLVAAGAACTIFSTLGFANSFGVLQEYYAVHQLRGESADRIAWIGSLSAFFQFAAGGIGGPLFDRYGAWVLRPAAVVYIFALMMTSLCTKYWHFMLAQGVLVGISTGLLQFPAMAAVSQFFDKKRAAALGIAVAGSSVGGIVFPIALSKMLNSSSLGFGWSIRIIAFIMVPTMIFSCLTVTARLPPRTTAFFIGSAFKNTLFMLICLSFFFMLLGMFSPLFFIPTYAVSRGTEPTLASYLVAIVNGASTFGRIIPGILADKFGRLNAFGIGGIATGIIICCMNEATSTAGLIVYSVIFGFWSGTIISGGSAAITLCVKRPQEFGTYLGSGIAMVGCAVLVGPPVSGVLVDKYGGFLELALFSGIICTFGGVVALGSKMATKEGLFGRI
ncbi:major facilitator superfamily domain-containing protein [Aspergillus pseudodeflectus]|uniref:Major facilitator superfamily domain-containing protein n=1 Tax=Aspergillus pseudodeflectus TaxID=176178 RepID=A0ABR4JXE7_9EURO